MDHQEGVAKQICHQGPEKGVLEAYLLSNRRLVAGLLSNCWGAWCLVAGLLSNRRGTGTWWQVCLATFLSAPRGMPEASLCAGSPSDIPSCERRPSPTGKRGGGSAGQSAYRKPSCACSVHNSPNADTWAFTTRENRWQDRSALLVHFGTPPPKSSACPVSSSAISLMPSGGLSPGYVRPERSALLSKRRRELMCRDCGARWMLK